VPRFQIPEVGVMAAAGYTPCDPDGGPKSPAVPQPLSKPRSHRSHDWTLESGDTIVRTDSRNFSKCQYFYIDNIDN